MKKDKSFKERETEQTFGRKRYIERLVETEEAQKQIDDYLTHGEEPEDLPGDLDENRTTSSNTCKMFWF